MSFENTGYNGSFHAGPGRDFTTRNKPRSNDPFSDDENHLRFILKVKTAQASQNMRSRVQRRLDNDPFFGRMNRRSNSRISKSMDVAVQSAPAFYEALNVLNDVVDFVVFKAELAASSLKLNPIKVLGRVGRITGGLGLFFSIWEAYEDRTLENIIVASLGGGVYIIGILVGLGVLTAPIWATIATGGAIVLFTWQVGKALYVAIKKGN